MATEFAVDVAEWLSGLGLGQYATAFVAEGVDLSVVSTLSDQDLKDLGVAMLGHRRKILLAAVALGAGPVQLAETALAAASETRPSPPPLRTGRDDAERRPITVMFCDLAGSTGMAAKLDAEDWRELVGAYLDEAAKAVVGFGGHVLKKLGDGLMALFGYPKAQENDAERAARAGLAILRALEELNAKNVVRGLPALAARIGLESGPVVVDATGEVFGDAPNVAARVQSAAEPGTLLVTAAVQRQVAGLFVAEDRGPHQLKGVPGKPTLYRLVRASGARRRGGARSLTPLIGRADELQQLARRWERARGGEGQFVQIVGEPGLGKSRLLDEFRGRLAETPHTWVEWSSSQLLQNTPLHPLAEWGRQRFLGEARLAELEAALASVKLDAAEHAPLLATLLDIPVPQDRAPKLAGEELRRRQMAALVAWLTAGARAQCIVLAFEDLHWADPTTLDLMKTLADRGAHAPMLIVATARPEFRAPWSTRSHHGVISLVPLDRGQIRQMVSAIAERHALARDVIEGVGDRTGGVPLFVEEVTRLMLEGGAQTIPPTLQQSLAARLDRLGEAREVAQIGAVLGREFSYPLLRDVAAVDESGRGGLEEAILQTALEKLADADLLFVEGTAPAATYRFKHALIQDAAYESLLKSRRQALHRRAAEALVAAPDPQPELVAHHFTQSGQTEFAIEWWGKAGDAALRRSAFQEAISHLGSAIEMADKEGEAAKTSAKSSNATAALQINYAQAMMAVKGYAAEETRRAYHRADLQTAHRGAEHWVNLNGQWASLLFQGDLPGARSVAEAFIREAEAAGLPLEAATGRRLLGFVLVSGGELAEGSAVLETALAAYSPDWQASSPAYGDFLCDTWALSAFPLWQMGKLELAVDRLERSIARAQEIGHALSQAVAMNGRLVMNIGTGRAAPAAQLALRLRDHAGEHALGLWAATAEVSLSWARCELGESESLMKLREAVHICEEIGGNLLKPQHLALLAEREVAGGARDEALATVDRGLEIAVRTGLRQGNPVLWRVRGDAMALSDHAAAELAYREALASAQEMGARTFELRAALQFAKLLRTTRPEEAYDILNSALEGFTPTPELPAIAEAQALLAELAQSDPVKGAEAQRQRRLHLQTAYGQAVMMVRGFASDETKHAFAQATKLSAKTGEFAERFAVAHGQWTLSLVRGELRSARALALAFLKEAEDAGYLVEAGVARRGLALVCLLAADFVEARTHCEQALALGDPERDRETRERFNEDTGTLAMSCLAVAMWEMGEVDRARECIDEANRRGQHLGHAPSMAHPLQWLSFLNLRRGDAAATLISAEALSALGRQNGMPFWAQTGEMIAAWAHGRVHDAAAGAEELRQALKAASDQRRSGNWGMTLLLAELEAETLGVERALARIDEAEAIAGQVEACIAIPSLHLLRGELLLKRDPSDPIAAEVSFQNALEVARRQGARSWGLRAALPLAKLYRSTNHPLEARDVLAPALEGFSPSFELPEIAEAQALLAEVMA